MDPTVADLRTLFRAEGASLLAQLERLTADDWSRPSPCDGWDLLDIVVHLQLGLTVHTRMVENGLAGLGEPAWGLPDGVDARTHFRQVHQQEHEAGPAHNVARLREHLAVYESAISRASDADLSKPVWFYGLPDSTLRRPISAFVNDLIVHATDIRRPLGLDPLFSPAGARFAGQATLAFLPMFTSADRLGGAAGVVHQAIDGLESRVTVGPGGVRITADAASDASDPSAVAADRPPARIGALSTDGGTWALIVWRGLTPAEAERQGRLQISGDRPLVEAYLGAIKTP
jgi:uncharacterized protein (TIGR03083 family)